MAAYKILYQLLYIVYHWYQILSVVDVHIFVELIVAIPEGQHAN